MNHNPRPARPLRGLTLVILLLLAATGSHAEAFKVLRFHADIQLNRDGSMDITEDILLEFSESKHGFIRKLPFRYEAAPFVQGEVARGHVQGEAYVTPITDIRVDGWDFTLTRGTSDYTIKIGSADAYVTGRQRYRIHYKVYGAINFFSKHQELYWNVNGNDWEVEFDSLDATVRLPDKKRLKEEDMKAFTGAFGSVLGGAHIEAAPGEARYMCTRRMNPREGLTIVARLPANYLTWTEIPLRARASNFVIDSLRTRMQLNPDGSVDVHERIVLDAVQLGGDFVRRQPLQYAGPVIADKMDLPLKYEPLGMELRADGNLSTVHGYYAANPPFYAQFTIPSSYFTRAGRHVVDLHYRLWGAAYADGKGVALHLPLIEPEPDMPLAACSLELGWAQSATPVLANVLLSSKTPKDGKVVLGTNMLRIDYPRPFADGEEATLCMRLPEVPVTIVPTPRRVDSPDAYYKRYHVAVTVGEDGDVHIENSFVAYQSQWYTPLKRPLTFEYDGYREQAFRPRKPHGWGTMGRYVVRNLTHDGVLNDYGYPADHELQLPVTSQSREAGDDSLAFSYDIYGILRDSAGAAWLDWPLVELLDHPADEVDFVIRFPGSALLTAQQVKVFIGPYYTYAVPVSLVFEPGVVKGKVVGGMAEASELMVKASLPQDAVGSSFALGLRNLWVNHKALFVPLFFLIPLAVVWFVWGRDKRFTTVVEYYPPDDLTPAEAGMLIDDKLHNRDLLSLIYYWGAKGYMSITEVYDGEGKVKDYQFTRLKHLPSGARKYEKTIFNALFASGTTTKVSAHNQKFYTYMYTARQELDKVVRSKNFYVPGTQGWATGIKVLGWLLGIVSVVLLGVVMFEATSWVKGRWEIPLGWGAATGLCFLFARIMPKKAGFGQKQYQKLVGFREFVLRADKHKLEELVHTNPDYFGLTLPYAIALGIATKWVEHFDGWLEAPPSYYNVSAEYRTQFYSQRQFEWMMRRQLDRMAASFNSSPPSSGGGGGGSWGGSSSSSSSSYSSRSSYSSSGSSGGSSYSSGGGYSGGGYGGGGGSSW